ncbi:hypothetical protein MES4922_180146 [Mesorhizobium ventifaucium]|uniref:Uncharacterized protein n=1 Tax=Mesorhizobium ventifaucium TaxID=666020 RepID=A0ABM9DKE2_9HYPH|nr:hypothetical protein MES4922_180146 [Mesorhizobium ventifaucium]
MSLSHEATSWDSVSAGSNRGGLTKAAAKNCTVLSFGGPAGYRIRFRDLGKRTPPKSNQYLIVGLDLACGLRMDLNGAPDVVLYLAPFVRCRRTCDP